eukprot:COSAG01_NODE_16949_length_1191_cov_1.414835_2_plen_99_part_00
MSDDYCVWLALQEDASVVQAFVHEVYRGSWGVDPAVETSPWWGLEMKSKVIDASSDAISVTQEAHLPAKARMQFSARAFRGGLTIKCASSMTIMWPRF